MRQLRPGLGPRLTLIGSLPKLRPVVGTRGSVRERGTSGLLCVLLRGEMCQYVGEIKGGLRPAMKLTVIGIVHSNPKSFSVTLLCDPVDANKDVGLLFTVNFSEKSITRNARIGGKWGKEEKTIPYFPFTAGDTFKMELLCEHQQIRVLLDGRQLCDFTHRIQPLNLVKVLQISGDIKLTKVA
ncbi:galectin-related protein A-like isoform X2 [Manacus candei]|uniref:galectin-related protein A-like isoform X2 n=1 Tax=Manacus candei TaxID=415023 RepID=UPI002227137B|nr:galectin-related protein A-like isoform X2 [Manacus candei]